jgi:hypothetical protein
MLRRKIGWHPLSKWRRAGENQMVIGIVLVKVFLTNKLSQNFQEFSSSKKE